MQLFAKYYLFPTSRNISSDRDMHTIQTSQQAKTHSEKIHQFPILIIAINLISVLVTDKEGTVGTAVAILRANLENIKDGIKVYQYEIGTGAELSNFE